MKKARKTGEEFHSWQVFNSHSRMDLNGACGLWNSIGAKLYGLVGERGDSPHPVHLGKQVHTGHCVVLGQANWFLIGNSRSRLDNKYENVHSMPQVQRRRHSASSIVKV